jgi:hypothetical protein
MLAGKKDTETEKNKKKLDEQKKLKKSKNSAKKNDEEGDLEYKYIFDQLENKKNNYLKRKFFYESRSEERD